MSGAFLYLAKSESTIASTVSVNAVMSTMLDARLDATTPAALVVQAAHILRRCFQFDVSGAYWVSPEHSASLTLAMTEGLPTDFDDIARSLLLSDFDQVADLPYNDDHSSCYGDFFASVAGTFGIRSWLVASLTDAETNTVIGAILLGSRDGSRFGASETQQILSLIPQISERLCASIQMENTDGLASLDSAA